MATLTTVPEELRDRITIPIADTPGFIALSPMGDPDPTYLINLETNRIPFKSALMDLADWDHAFRSWPNRTPGWKKWYLRMDNSKRVF
uniref:Uncharacterized protein n=1 Tax=Setaria viridis TaxID=4556 RepID=A0A4U6UX12_SETVI|nr:hypothetical protein SEVIR_4G174600v2 [Setaria viridis]